MDNTESKKQIASVYKDGICPHGSNIRHQLNNKRLHAKKVKALTTIVPAYLEFVKDIDDLDLTIQPKSFKLANDILEKYLNALWKPETNCFDSVTDFYTSAAPEFFLRILDKMITILGLKLEASGQRNIPIELAFDPNSNPVFIPKYQRVDIAVFEKQELVLESEALEGFCIPVYVAESKTYFDKNMISGVAHSSASLKTTFPRCVSVCIGEWTDYDLNKQSFAATAIDEIYIMRNQKRSDYRSTKVFDPLSVNTVQIILNQAWEVLSNHENVHPPISERLKSGKLVNSEMEKT